MLTEKDEQTLINKPNKLLADYHARVMVKEVPEAILSFYESNADKINGEVIIVRSKDDEPQAARARNALDKVLFVFGDKYWLDSYFSGVCQNIPLSNALINRALKVQGSNAEAIAKDISFEDFEKLNFLIQEIDYSLHKKFLQPFIDAGFVIRDGCSVNWTPSGNEQFEKLKFKNENPDFVDYGDYECKTCSRKWEANSSSVCNVCGEQAKYIPPVQN